MNNIMKNSKLLALICALSLLFVSCEKVQKNEWANFYGYTNEDIIGTYSFSNISDAFDGVEGTGRHACPDAEISISAVPGSSLIDFAVNCPSANFSKQIVAAATPNEGDFMIQMSTGINYNNKAYEVEARVLKNDKQEIRLSGFIAETTYEYQESENVGHYVKIDGVYYYFDVIKN